MVATSQRRAGSRGASKPSFPVITSFSHMAAIPLAAQREIYPKTLIVLQEQIMKGAQILYHLLLQLSVDVNPSL